ncbi:probable RNA methyltransferase At5g51130 [Hordeum vulgare subsp. vulgare]|uniref:RNA methyltransferase n=1 Tax=Hordeum vulgare subsp. vulgare TaxID=112509 RepID=F2EIF4_HORVV|nr:probable RNA methyltransferase At5g51130 [Hordeum vulgare subsp. vulgare]KAI4974675.1 hypothetical protein ZWY2020_048282 [Hordeum vulgare]BAK07126.1 predicted protein [Hordeum vulgare subsp. vulgare]
MVTTAAPEGVAQPPSAVNGPKGEAERKQSDAQERGGNGCGGSGGGGGAGGGGGRRGKKRKNKGGAFIYGNYRNYYGYRIDRNVGEDPRLEIFKKEWFAGKDCLDIGCNQGLVTIGLAMKFECQSILGVDIDEGLIDLAKWNLRRISRTGNMAPESAKVHNSSESTTQSHQEEVVSGMPNGNISKHARPDLFEIVSFRSENFIQRRKCSEQYDTIMCLSVTKWIHLNWGDDGIITLFVKIWSLLRPGGIFIMEPQPWTSYRKNRLVSEFAKENFKYICIYPEKFREVLLDKVGFRSVEVITNGLVGSVAGFDRPIEVYYK